MSGKCPTCKGAVNSCGHSKQNVVWRRLGPDGYGQSICWECQSASNSVTAGREQPAQGEPRKENNEPNSEVGNSSSFMAADSRHALHLRQKDFAVAIGGDERDYINEPTQPFRAGGVEGMSAEQLARDILIDYGRPYLLEPRVKKVAEKIRQFAEAYAGELREERD